MATVLDNRMFAQRILIAVLGRALAVLIAGLLAACAGTTATTETAPVAAASRPPVAAGRGQTPPPAPPTAEPASQPAPTLQKARAECWMKMETDRKAPKEPEKRLPLVEKCVKEKMSATAPPQPAPAPQ